MHSIISYINLIIYIVLWIVTFLFYKRKRCGFDVNSFVIISYFIYGIISFILYIDPIYGNKFNNLSLFPFIYLYLMILLAMRPILKLNFGIIRKIQAPSSVIINIVSLIFIIFTLVRLPNLINNFSSDVVMLFTDMDFGAELYNDSLENSYTSGRDGISNLPAIVSEAFYYIGVLLFFYYLYKYPQKKGYIFCLAISCITSIVGYITSGERGALFMKLLLIVVTYLMFRRFYSKKINKVLKVIGLVIILGVTLTISIVTISRFGQSSNNREVLSSVFFYAGQENLYFNNYALDNNGIRYGDRTIPLFKRMVGIDNVPHNFWERRQKYPHLYIDDYVFYTFVGDFTIDFGPILAVFIFALCSLIATRSIYVKNNQILFHQLILAHFIVSLCAQGGMELFMFSDIGGNLTMIVYFVAYWVFKLDYEYRINNSIKTRYD